MNISSMPALTPNKPIDATTVGIAMLAKNLNKIEEAGQDLIKMMEQSVQPNLGANIDLQV